MAGDVSEGREKGGRSDHSTHRGHARPPPYLPEFSFCLLHDFSAQGKHHTAGFYLRSLTSRYLPLEYISRVPPHSTARDSSPPSYR